MNQQFSFTIYAFLLLFALLVNPLCISCNSQKKPEKIQNVDVASNMNNWQVINLSRFTNNIKYVPLETNEKLPIAWLKQVEISGNSILVTDMRSCLLYDTKGQFIAKIGSQGRGPGEYGYIENLGFVYPNLILLQNGYDLLEYNSNGTFVRKYKKCFMFNKNEDQYFQSWLVIDDSLLFGHTPNTTGFIENKALIMERGGEIKYQYKNYIRFKRERTMASGFENYANIYVFNNSVYYKEFYIDTLFYLNDDYQLIPRYSFSLGKFKESVSERVLVKDMAKHLFIWDVFQTDKYLFINCQYGDHFPALRLTTTTVMGHNKTRNTINALGVYNKQTKELSFCKPTSTDNPLYTSGIYNDIDGGPRFFPTKQVNDSTMLMWVKANELKDHVASDDFKKAVVKYTEKKEELERLANSLSETDNPVLMFVTIRKKD